MATLSSILSWRIPWTQEPGRLQSMRLQRFRHDWSDLAHSTLGCDKVQRKYRCAVGVDCTSLHLSLCTKTCVGWSHPCSSHRGCSCTCPFLPQTLTTHLRTVTPGSHLESLPHNMNFPSVPAVGWDQEHTESQGFRARATTVSLGNWSLSLPISKEWSTVSTHCQTAPHNCYITILARYSWGLQNWLIDFSLSLTLSLSPFLCISFSDR